MPNALLEAASLGIPIVASDIEEIKNISQPSWLLAPINNLEAFKELITYAYKNHNRLKKDAQMSVKLVMKKYSISASAKKYLQIFDSLNS